MRILYINSVVDFGSTGRIVRNLANAQDESLVCFGRKAGKSEDYKMTALPGNIESALATILFDRNGFANRKETRRLVALIREYDPDIIHLHNLHGYYLNIETLFDFLKQYKKPVVWTLHDCWSYTGYCPHYDGIGCSKWETGCTACPYPFAYPFSLFKQHTLENYEKKKRIFNGVEKLMIVTPSVWLKNEVQHSFLSAYPVRVIPNGIDLKNFNPKGREKKRPFSILFVSSLWTKEKGSEEIKKLLPLLNKDIQTVIIGQGSEMFKSIPNVTVFPRTSSQAELAGHYRNADLFINLTLQDNFPTVNIEALNCGTPVITYATGGSPEIADERTGAVVAKGDYEKTAELINHFSKENPFLAAECSDRGRRFSAANMTAAYTALYKELYTISD